MEHRCICGHLASSHLENGIGVCSILDCTCPCAKNGFEEALSVTTCRTDTAEMIMVDWTAPEHVNVTIRDDGKVIWVNVDGRCAFRACRIGVFELDDRRMPSYKVHDVR